MACQSVPVTGKRPDEGAWSVLGKASGEGDLVCPRDDEGRELGGDWRRRVGNFGDGTHCSGESGLEGVCELANGSASTRGGLDVRLPLSREGDEDGGD